VWAPGLAWTGHCGPVKLLKFHLTCRERNSGRPAQQVTIMTELLCPLHHSLSLGVIKELSCTKYSTCKIVTNKRNPDLHYTRRINNSVFIENLTVAQLVHKLSDLD